MVDEYSPKLIITFGKNYTEKYQDFFGFKDIKLKHIGYKSDTRLELKYAYKNDEILFVNTYFPSNGWLTSVKALNETGEIIKELLDEKKININQNN